MKKVVCKDSNAVYGNCLTIGKIYNIISENSYGYNIINDDGYNCNYFKYRFKQLSKSEIRNEKIDKLLE